MNKKDLLEKLKDMLEKLKDINTTLENLPDERVRNLVNDLDKITTDIIDLIGEIEDEGISEDEANEA